MLIVGALGRRDAGDRDHLWLASHHSARVTAASAGRRPSIRPASSACSDFLTDRLSSAGVRLRGGGRSHARGAPGGWWVIVARTPKGLTPLGPLCARPAFVFHPVREWRRPDARAIDLRPSAASAIPGQAAPAWIDGERQSSFGSVSKQYRPWPRAGVVLPEGLAFRSLRSCELDLGAIEGAFQARDPRGERPCAPDTGHGIGTPLAAEAEIEETTDVLAFPLQGSGRVTPATVHARLRGGRGGHMLILGALASPRRRRPG